MVHLAEVWSTHNVAHAVPVDADPLRVRARAEEALHPALLAEDVPCPTRAEAIGRRLALALGDPECVVGHDQVERIGHPADRAIALSNIPTRRLEIA